MFDVIVIGGGPGGYRAAYLLGRKNFKVALVEEENIGGVCLNQGCIPFKSYLHTARTIQEANCLVKENVIAGNAVSLSQSLLCEKREAIIKGLRQGVMNSLKTAGITVYKGTASIAECNDGMLAFHVNGEIIKGKKAVIATGSEEKQLQGIEDASTFSRVIGSREMLEFTEIPDNIDIIGGGAIGLETASFLCDVGCKVTVIEAGSHIGGGLDQEIADGLKKILGKKGIQIFTDTKFARVKDQTLIYESSGNEQTKSPEYVIVSIGRKPRIDGKMLDVLGVKYSIDGIEIDDSCRTSNENVYACGDVTGKLMLAHTAYQQARVIADSMAGIDAKMNYDHIPRIIYSNPEVLSIGVSEEDCKKRGIYFEARTLPMTYSGKYFAENGKDGAKAKMIINEEKRMVGFHMIGNCASEISLAVEMMIANHMRIDSVQNIIYPHPTYGEIICDLAEAFS